MRLAWIFALIAVAACSSPSAEPSAPTEPASEHGDAAVDAQVGPTAAEQAVFEQVRADMEAKLAEHGVPGGAIAIVIRKKLAFAAGVGVKRKGDPAPVTADSLFRVASMTKPIVATGILKLREETRVDLARPVTTYVPGFRRAAGFDASDVTIEHLLTHTSGIPDEEPNRCSTDPSYFDKWLTARADDPYWSPPGRLFNYSNANFALAALTIQRVTKTPFHEYLRDQVLRPAGMQTATFDPAEAGDDRTSGHPQFGSAKGKIYDFSNYDCAISRAYMGVIASAKDYAHFVEHMLSLGGDVLSATSIRDMQTGHVATGTGDDSGFGLFTYFYRGLQIHGHDGRAHGWKSHFMYVPKEGFGVVVLLNADEYSPVEIGVSALTSFLAPTRPVTDGRTQPSTWGPFAGSYVDPYGWLGTTQVVRSGNRMFLDLPDRAVRSELFSVGANAFTFEYGGNWLSGTFFLDDAGTGEYFATRYGVARRVASAPAAAPAAGEPPAASPPDAAAAFAYAIAHASHASALRASTP